jgi:hypothetical protein
MFHPVSHKSMRFSPDHDELFCDHYHRAERIDFGQTLKIGSAGSCRQRMGLAMA